MLLTILAIVLAVPALFVAAVMIRDFREGRVHDSEAFQAGYRSAQSYNRPDFDAEVARTMKYADDKNLNPYSKGYLQGIRDRVAAS